MCDSFLQSSNSWTLKKITKGSTCSRLDRNRGELISEPILFDQWQDIHELERVPR
jgi:hypothetical protein